MKKSQILLIVSIILAAIVFTTWILLPRSQKTAPTPGISYPSTRPEASVITGNGPILSISPDRSVILQPDQKQQFIVTIKSGFIPGDFTFKLTFEPFSSEKTPTAMSFDLTSKGNTITITTKDNIAPNSTYYLEVLQQDRVVSQTKYLSDIPLPVKEISNHLELVKYLPYKTTNYSLVYLPDQNMYVFSFSVDPESKQSIEKQFDKAKSDALAFIRSKNIDPNSLKIDWRYH